jgi:SAM-dependent methyltransferase
MPDATPSTTPQTLAGYDLWSSAYDAADNPLIAMVNRALELDPEPVSNKHLLEIGCGTARLASLFFAQGAASYTGVDGSPGMLAQARLQAEPRIRLLEADIHSALPLPPHSFDVIFISLVLEHTATLGPIFENIARLLAHNGTVRILELHADRQRAGTTAHFPHNGQDIRLPSYPHDAAELQHHLTLANLINIRIIDRTPDPESLAHCPRLAKYKGFPLLLDVRANSPEFTL